MTLSSLLARFVSAPDRASHIAAPLPALGATGEGSAFGAVLGDAQSKHVAAPSALASTPETSDDDALLGAAAAWTLVPSALTTPSALPVPLPDGAARTTGPDGQPQAQPTESQRPAHLESSPIRTDQQLTPAALVLEHQRGSLPSPVHPLATAPEATHQSRSLVDPLSSRPPASQTAQQPGAAEPQRTQTNAASAPVQETTAQHPASNDWALGSLEQEAAPRSTERAAAKQSAASVGHEESAAPTSPPDVLPQRAPTGHAAGESAPIPGAATAPLASSQRSALPRLDTRESGPTSAPPLPAHQEPTRLPISNTEAAQAAHLPLAGTASESAPNAIWEPDRIPSAPRPDAAPKPSETRTVPVATQNQPAVEVDPARPERTESAHVATLDAAPGDATPPLDRAIARPVDTTAPFYQSPPLTPERLTKTPERTAKAAPRSAAESSLHASPRQTTSNTLPQPATESAVEVRVATPNVPTAPAVTIPRETDRTKRPSDLQSRSEVGTGFRTYARSSTLASPNGLGRADAPNADVLRPGAPRPNEPLDVAGAPQSARQSASEIETSQRLEQHAIRPIESSAESADQAPKPVLSPTFPADEGGTDRPKEVAQSPTPSAPDAAGAEAAAPLAADQPERHADTASVSSARPHEASNPDEQTQAPSVQQRQAQTQSAQTQPDPSPSALPIEDAEFESRSGNDPDSGATDGQTGQHDSSSDQEPVRLVDARAAVSTRASGGADAPSRAEHRNASVSSAAADSSSTEPLSVPPASPSELTGTPDSATSFEPLGAPLESDWIAAEAGTDEQNGLRSLADVGTQRAEVRGTQSTSQATGSPVSARWAPLVAEARALLSGGGGGWQQMQIELGEGGGSVTVRARREAERVVVSVGFSDPSVRAQAMASADRLHESLRAEFGGNVDFSFDAQSDARDQAADRSPSTPSASRSTSPRSAPAPTATARPTPGAQSAREWIG